MPRFRYPLQPALERAVAREREARAVVARAEAALDAERRALAALDSRLVHALREFVVPDAERAGAGVAWPHVAAHVEALVKLRATRRRSLRAARDDAADSRAAHDLTRRQQSALGRHRARRHQAFVLACERRDAAELDELSALGRKAAAGRIGN